MLVDTDLWLCVLDVALREGWRPLGTKYPDAALSRASTGSIPWQPLAYFLPLGQSIDAKDAGEIARCFSLAMDEVPDTEVPLQGRVFGEENTLFLLRLAADRETIPRANTEAALEILSGPPKREARALIRFLRCGHVTIGPPESPGPGTNQRIESGGRSSGSSA